MADMTIADRVLRRCQQLEAEREPHIPVWREVCDYMAPERGQGWYDGQYVSAATNAGAQRARIMDSTAIDGLEVLKSNISSGLTPENSRWFSLDVGQDDESSTRWMDGAAQFLFENINAAGFSATSQECYSDLLPAGWFVLYMDEARGARGEVIGGFNFEAWPLHQCCVAASRSGGRVDIIRRKWWPTVEQVVREYGLDKVSEHTARAYREGKLSDKVEMLWLIEPRMDAAGMLARNKPFSSIHMEVSGKHIVRESGYDEFPCAVPRWRLIPGSAYATGIGSNVLPDVRTLNKLIELELLGLDIAVSGMWKATDDGVLNPRTVKIGPRRVLAVADMNNFQRLETGADFNVSFSKQDRLQQNIRRALLADMLTPVGGPVRSATEIQQNMNQIRQLLAPILGRLQQEFLQVMIERLFNIAFRAGALMAHLGPLPQSLAQSGGSYTVRYVSPLARSQKMEEVNSVETFAASLMQLAQGTGQATVLDVLKLDQAAYDTGLARGVPAKLLRGPEELAAKREMDNQARQAAQQQAQQQQLQQAAGMSAVDTAAKAAA